VTRIKTGVGKGLAWRRRHRYQSGFYLGTYEPIVQEFLAANLQGGSVFWDVGANAGFFTVLGGRLVGNTGKVIAFEPFPESANSIREQVALNELSEVCEVVEAAVTSEVGKAKLLTTDHNATHRLDPEGETEVGALSLDSMLGGDSGLKTPDLIKVDVEGAELEVLAGAGRLIESGTSWLIEAHGLEIENRIREILSQKGYSVTEIGDRDLDGKILLSARIE
jgi:FkbM family methyltransferase